MKKIIDEKEYTLVESCTLLGVNEHSLKCRLMATEKNGESVYRGADLLRLGRDMAIEKFNIKMEDKK